MGNHAQGVNSIALFTVVLCTCLHPRGDVESGLESLEELLVAHADTPEPLIN